MIGILWLVCLFLPLTLATCPVCSESIQITCYPCASDNYKPDASKKKCIPCPSGVACPDCASVFNPKARSLVEAAPSQSSQ